MKGTHPISSTLRLAPLVACLLFVAGVAPASGAQHSVHQQNAGATCSFPESDAQYVEIYPKAAAWDHADLTVAIRLHPKTTDQQVSAVTDAVATWNSVLDECLDGAVTLTTISGAGAPGRADIILRFIPAAGGAYFLGLAICHGNHSSPSACNVIVSGGEGAVGRFPALTPTEVHWVALHEIGHALGLGHAQPIEETIDLMGYGSLAKDVPPVLSDCDVDALYYIWHWAIEGTTPTIPKDATYDCSRS